MGRAWLIDVAVACVISSCLCFVSASAGSAAAQSAQPQQSYLLVGQDGGVFTYGVAFFCGSAVGRTTSRVVGIASGGSSYWVASADGSVYAPSCNPVQTGSAHGLALAAPITGIASSGGGYWLVGGDGGVFNYGDAKFFGSAAGMHFHGPIVAIVGTADHGGYWLVGQDGALFTFGDARDFGSVCVVPPNNGAGNGALPSPCPAGVPEESSPVVGIAATPDGKGYWLATSAGGVYTFGDALFFGSLGDVRLNAPIVGISASPPPENCGASGRPPAQGYWLVGADGGVFAFGDAQFLGSATGSRLNAPMAGIATGPQSACGAGPG